MPIVQDYCTQVMLQVNSRLLNMNNFALGFSSTISLPHPAFLKLASTLCTSFTTSYSFLLGKCRTLWGERELAALNCYITKVLPVKYQITAHRPWHVAKQGLSLYCGSVSENMVCVCLGMYYCAWECPAASCLVWMSYCNQTLFLSGRVGSGDETTSTSE